MALQRWFRATGRVDLGTPGILTNDLNDDRHTNDSTTINIIISY